MIKPKSLDDSLRAILHWRELLDPRKSVSVYDLHFDQGEHTGYCLVAVPFLDDLWRESGREGMLPHEHIGDLT